MWTLLLTGWMSWTTQQPSTGKPVIGTRSILGILFPNLTRRAK